MYLDDDFGSELDGLGKLKIKLPKQIGKALAKVDDVARKSAKKHIKVLAKVDPTFKQHQKAIEAIDRIKANTRELKEVRDARTRQDTPELAARDAQLIAQLDADAKFLKKWKKYGRIVAAVAAIVAIVFTAGAAAGAAGAGAGGAGAGGAGAWSAAASLAPAALKAYQQKQEQKQAQAVERANAEAVAAEAKAIQAAEVEAAKRQAAPGAPGSTDKAQLIIPASLALAFLVLKMQGIF